MNLKKGLEGLKNVVCDLSSLITPPQSPPLPGVGVHHLVKIQFISILFSLFLLFFGVSTATAITFSFDSYQGVIGGSFGDYYDTPTYESVGYGTMNGVKFNNDNINHSLGEYVEIYTDYPEYPGYPEYADRYFRGERTFDADTTQVDFNSSMLKFDVASDSDFAIGEEFLLGTFTFTNGGWYIDSQAAEFNFNIKASSSVTGLGEQSFSGTLMLYTNSNNLDTREERADWFYIKEEPGFGSIRVFENLPGMLEDGDNTGSIELWGKFGSLDLVGLRNPTGGAFLNGSTTPDLTSPVPEPSTILLFGIGLAGLAAARRRKKAF